jgi:PhnB protein
MTIQPYLFFDGRTEEAINFYRETVGAEVQMLMRFKDNPEKGQNPGCDPGPAAADKVMHASFKIGDSVVMASDGQCSGKPNFQGFGLALNAKDEAEAKRFFTGLGEGGQVQAPLSKTFFSPAFGMVTDRFGIMWMVIVPQAMQDAVPGKQHAHA